MHSKSSIPSEDRMHPEEAQAIARRLLASYPSARLTDPEVYLAELLALLSGYSRYAAESAIRTVQRKTPSFVPSIAELEQALEQHSPLVRRGEHVLLPPVEANRSNHLSLEELKAKYGERWGLTQADSNKPKPKSVDQIRDELVGQVGQAAFDAIPDARNYPKTAHAAALQALNRSATERGNA